MCKECSPFPCRLTDPSVLKSYENLRLNNYDIANGFIRVWNEPEIHCWKDLPNSEGKQLEPAGSILFKDSQLTTSSIQEELS